MDQDKIKYQRLINELQKADSKLIQRHKRGILLCGPSRVGKTTLLYHLLGEGLKQEQFEGDEVYNPVYVINDAHVSHLPSSCTILPNIFQCPNSDIWIVDLPGFEDTNPQARITNSYYIRRTMLCFDQISLVFVVDSEAAFMRKADSKDFIDSLNNIGGMFNTEKQTQKISEAMKYVSLCVSKSTHEDKQTGPVEALKHLLPQNRLNANAKKLVEYWVEQPQKKITFFMKPTYKSQQTTGRDMVANYNTPNRYWKVNDAQINYHVLMKEGCKTKYLETTIKYIQLCKKQLRKILSGYEQAIREIIDNLHKEKKNYTFIQNWKNTVKEINCQRPTEGDNSLPSKVYTALKSLITGELQYQYFCEYEFIQKYLEQVKKLINGSNQYVPLQEYLCDIKKMVRLTIQELKVWEEFYYIFTRKRTEIKFLTFLAKVNSKLDVDIYNMFKSPISISFQAHCEKMVISTTHKDEAYYKKALDLLCSFQVEGNEDMKIAKPSLNGNKIRLLRSVCYSCLGDLSHNQQNASFNYARALIEKRQIRNKQNLQEMMIEQAEICLKLGHKLYYAKIYDLAIKMFKVCNNFTMIYKCIIAQPPSYSTLIESGKFFASILQLQKASEMYQRAFDSSRQKQNKLFAWGQIIKLTKDKQSYIKRFVEKVNQQEIVNQLTDLDRIIKDIKQAFTMRGLTQTIQGYNLDEAINDQGNTYNRKSNNLT